jgi:hypothetical protein
MAIPRPGGEPNRFLGPRKLTVIRVMFVKGCQLSLAPPGSGSFVSAGQEL